jgi:hypothetical protein
VRLTMSSLSQALPLEDLPSSHSAFQEHAAHIAAIPAEPASPVFTGSAALAFRKP